MSDRLSHLERLEAESIHIIREVAAECRNPVMLYSIGKDSSVMLHLARKAFYPGAAAFPADARRHDVEVPRDDRLPRPDGGGSRHAAHRPHQPGGREGRAQPVRPRAELHARHEDRGAEAGARPAQVRRGLRRRAPRRGEEPRQGAHLLLPLGEPRLGSEEPAAGALAPLQHARPRRRIDARLPAVELDRARHLGLHPAGRASRSCRSISPPSGRSSTAQRPADHGRRRAAAASRPARRRRCGWSASARSAAIR